MLIRPLVAVASTDVEVVRVIAAIVLLLVAVALFSRPARDERWYRP